ncbi:hypothetical protein BEP19_02990 [Ammoniphilus oxalaticus]|uniref:DUF4181 domain-containing protein n=1 Tax=Ammoniphilus oxalaticus TaxID=66863 RepID=A0A419SNN6_9BACL|nr:DUF4181 domain-containing protein [Ammoniphilus oxalaticus]RKD25910.1 hypothetical protein BEP19_02990 [Ammoniphilus oxalaticus]
MAIIIFGILLLVLFLLLEKVTRRILGVKKQKISVTRGRHIDQWGRGAIFVVFISAIPFVVTTDGPVLKWYFMFYFLLMLGLRSILEWKYLKSSKQYVATLIFTFVVVVMFYSVDSWMLELYRLIEGGLGAK